MEHVCGLILMGTAAPGCLKLALHIVKAVAGSSPIHTWRRLEPSRL